MCIIICYVDDNFTVGTPGAPAKAVEEIKSHGLSVTVDYQTNDYLLCDIKFDKDRSKAWIGQPHMVKKIKKSLEVK